MTRWLLHYRHFLLLLAFIPFCFWVWRAPTVDDPDLAIFASSTEAPLLAADSQMHWLMAAASAVIFFAAAILLFTRYRVRPASLLATAAFTGTLGVILLLLFQQFAASSGNG